MNVWQKTKDSRLKRRGDKYWARFMTRGQLVQKSLETSSFDTAKRLVENIERDILLGVNWRRERELFETAWVDFLEDKAKGIKTKKARDKTLKEYIGFGERYFKPFLNEKRLDELEDAWSEMVDQVRLKKPNMHLDNLRKYLMGFSSWAYKKGKIRIKPEFYDPDVERRAELEKDGPGLAYSLAQLKVMRKKAKKLSPRYFLFMLMAQYMGMRPSEITQLKKDRIDLGLNIIKLRRSDTKTATSRDVPIHPLVKSLLVNQMNASGSEFLFPNRNDCKRPMDPTGFKKYWYLEKDRLGRVYDFRHTFISHALSQGMNLAAVAKMTGTSLKMIEKRYLHLSPKDLNREIKKFRL